MAAALAASCTTPPPDAAPSPTPSPTDTPVATPARGERITVIVPPETVVAPAEGNALARAATELAAEPPEGVAEIRVVEAISEAFARDLAELAVDDGHDLVCVVGTGAAALVLELARARRDGRFCATDVTVAGGPVNIVAVGVDPAALVEAGAVAVGSVPAPVGLLLVEQLGDQEALGSRFMAAVPVPQQPTAAATAAPGPSPPSTSSPPSPAPAPLAPGASPSPTAPAPTAPMPAFAVVTAGTGGATQVAAAEQLADQRPSRAVVLAPLGGSAAATAAAATGAELVVVSDWAVDAEGELPSGLLVALTVDWQQLLEAAIAAARAPDPAQVQALGIADGVLGALPGTAETAAAAADRTVAHLRQAAAAAEAAEAAGPGNRDAG